MFVWQADRLCGRETLQRKKKREKERERERELLAMLLQLGCFVLAAFRLDAFFQLG
jgi:hypothetical protein